MSSRVTIVSQLYAASTHLISGFGLNIVRGFNKGEDNPS